MRALLLIGVAVFSGRVVAPAAITVLDHYRLGDADAGALAGNIGNSTSTDSAGRNDVLRSGTPTYSSDVPFQTTGEASGSLSMSFSGADPEDYVFSRQLSDVQDNFGLEAFVNASSTSSDAGIVYNGKGGSSGFGLVRRGGVYQALLGTSPGTLFGSATATPGTWVHLAVVRENGLSTFYADGVASGTSSATPLFGSGPFRIGSSVGSDNFAGMIDEVRLFTFAPGLFSRDDLLVNQVPEPGTTTLVILGLIGFRRLIGAGRS